MTKKEFKKKCKEEKTTSYKLMLLGGIIATIGFIVVIVTMLFIKRFETSITGFVLGGVIAFIGMILDSMGEVMLEKKFKELEQENKT